MIRTLKIIYGLLCVLALPTHAALPIANNQDDLPSLAPMLEQVTPAVVNISTEGRIRMQENPLFSEPFFRHFFDLPNRPLEQKTQSLGSGVIVDAKRGLVLTNSHVIANAVQITVTLHDGRHLEAELVGHDQETDVALIKIPAKGLAEIKTADSDKLRVGDYVIAIGNPFALGQTVTSGIISALSRSGLGIEDYEDFIQTDASINPGNSGGALVNLRGELVGINTAILSRFGGNIGIGFAIPINLALQITEQLLNHGKVKRGFLGVQIQDLTPDLAKAFNLPQQQGAIVVKVLKDSPAEEVGLIAGDIIISINGKPTKNSAAVRNRIGLLPVNKRVKFKILRNGKKKTLTATIAENTHASRLPDATNTLLKGVTLGNIQQNNPAYGRIEGVIVTNIERGSTAWHSGLRQGDLITSVNRVKVKDLEGFLRLVDHQNTSLLLRIIRGNMAAFLVIKRDPEP